MIIISQRILLLLILILLSACSSSLQNRGDGPPMFNVDVSKIPNAVPKAEPKSKYGNPKSYIVRGRRYYVLKTSTGYDKRGLASWYGSKFHRRRTSSGEPYNMFKMTAASLTLPLPSYAEVTNLRNGRKVIVKVNDRGPFDKNRIMDLSFVAAKKLGITRTGTAPVEVKAINPYVYGHNSPSYRETTYKPAISKYQREEHTKIFLQVGAYVRRTNAIHVLDEVKHLTEEPTQIETIYAHGTPHYRVKIGPLADLHLSERVRQLLSASGLSGIPVIE
jgi:rare lipoprotein A